MLDKYIYYDILASVKKKTLQVVHMSSIDVEEVVELSMLYDFYGALLKENKRKIFEAYVMDDYSLGEISNEVGMSRQGVHDTVKRCSRELREFEEKLGLMKKFKNQQKIMDQAGTLFDRLKPYVPDELREDFDRSYRDIQEILEM